MKEISRRKAAMLLGATPMAAALARLKGQNVGSAVRSQEGAKVQSSEAWMESWIKEAKKDSNPRIPFGGLYLGRFKDPIYFLTRPIKWQPGKGQEKFKEVTVPQGFVTDFASIPQVFWSLLKPDGEYAWAAVVHDYLYWFQERSRAESDTIFELGMNDFKINPLISETIYGAVHLAGGSSWSTNEQLRKAGEKRILKRFPDNPLLRWTDWKRDPANVM